MRATFEIVNLHERASFDCLRCFELYETAFIWSNK